MNKLNIIELNLANAKMCLVFLYVFSFWVPNFS